MSPSWRRNLRAIGLAMGTARWSSGAPVHQVNCVIRVRFGASGVRQVSVRRRAVSFEMISQR